MHQEWNVQRSSHDLQNILIKCINRGVITLTSFLISFSFINAEEMIDLMFRKSKKNYYNLCLL